MPKLEKDLNPWLFSYVRHHHKERSRYEIDRYLIETGANPAEIEEVWTYLATLPAGKLPRRAMLKSHLFSVGSTFSRIPQASSSFSKTVWLTLGRGIQKTFSLTKTILSISELWWLSFSIILFILALATIDVLQFYGFVFVEKALAWPLALTSLISVIVYLKKLSNQAANSFKRSLLAWIAVILMGLSIPLYSLMGVFGTFAGSYKDMATTQVNGHTYHLTLYEGLWADSPSHFELYKCEILGLICPRAERERAYIDRTDGPYHLNYNLATQRLEVWAKGVLIGTFKQKVD